jgi:hypothetical protein
MLQCRMEDPLSYSTAPLFRPKAATMQVPSATGTISSTPQYRCSDPQSYVQQAQSVNPLCPSPPCQLLPIVQNPLMPLITPCPMDVQGMCDAGLVPLQHCHVHQAHGGGDVFTPSYEVGTLDFESVGSQTMPAQSLIPCDWADPGTPRMSTNTICVEQQVQQAQLQQQLDDQQLQDHQYQQRLSTEDMLPMPPRGSMNLGSQGGIETEMLRQQSMGVQTGPSMPGSTRSAPQPSPPAVWSSDGLAHLQQVANVSDAPEPVPHQQQLQLRDSQSSPGFPSGIRTKAVKSMWQPVSSRMIEERVRSRDGVAASMGPTSFVGQVHTTSPKAAVDAHVKHVASPLALANAAAVHAQVPNSLTPAVWSTGGLSERNTKRVSVAPSVHSDHRIPSSAGVSSEEFRNSTMRKHPPECITSSRSVRA